MLISNKSDNTVIDHMDHLPKILALTAGGEPMEWITYEDCATYEAKGKIAWRIGQTEVTMLGGTNAKSGLQSKLVFDTIVAIHTDKSPSKFRRTYPSLTNKTLFERDRNLCAYCGSSYKTSALTRDHVIPSSRGGKDTWENCVTACYGCNQYKGDKTLEAAEMKLLYVPYAPNFHEYMILSNRKILADQMDYLMKHVSKHSRLHLN